METITLAYKRFLPVKRHLLFAADDNFKFCRFFKNNQYGMIFHENRLLADDSHEISYLIILKLGKMSQNLSSAAVVIGALRVNANPLVLNPD